MALFKPTDFVHVSECLADIVESFEEAALSIHVDGKYI
jgi:hypothetical protein